MHHLSRWMPRALGALALAFGGLSNTSCDPVDCGDGTIEKDGACVPADDNPGSAQCGPGTVLGPSGKCEPEQVVICDPGTTRAEEDPVTHVITCVGTGGTGCTGEIQCPAPSPGKLTICGQLHDTETGDKIAEAGATGATCGATPTADGPCSLRLRFYDAVAFAGDPMTATPIPPATLVVDTCGRFRATDLAAPVTGFIGMGVDDAPGTSARHKLTGIALPNAEAVPATGVEGYATKNETDAAWSSSASVTPSFATRGVLAAVFRHGGMPVSGVTVRRDGAMIPADDYYFSDAAGVRRTVDPARTTTGANGTALAVDASHSVVNYDGVGGVPAGCDSWAANLAGAIAGVVFVQIKPALTSSGAICP